MTAMRIRLLTYNVHKCIGGIDRRYRPERIRQVIAHYAPDFALLQEVDSGARRSNGDAQVDLLGGLLDMHYRAFYPNVRIKSGGAYGNALLSHHPISESDNIDLSVRLKKRRSVLHARCRLRPHAGAAGRVIHLFNLHLGLSGFERKLQLRRFLENEPFAGLDRHTPVIVAGDFNDVWGTLGRTLLEPAGFRGLVRPILTFPAFAPLRALDSIYVRGDIEFVRVFRARASESLRASDHLPLVADLELH
jgi:endonuclease/exonuclease/phosphatase family metal-dependent hydrolase